MILKNISVKNLGGISDFSCELCDNLSTIESQNIDDISYAIRLVLNHKLPPLQSKSVRVDTKIFATLINGDRRYQISATPNECADRLNLKCYDKAGGDVTEEYLYLSAHSSEQDFSDVFDNLHDCEPLEFLKYKYEDLYYSPRELSKKRRDFQILRHFGHIYVCL
jgi:hypothetical protein